MSTSRSSKPRTRTAGVFASLPAMLVTALLVVGPAKALAKDTTAPVFEGLQSAWTCIPGPIGAGQKTHYNLKWNAAKDDVTPSSEIVYKIYRATIPGGENFSRRTYRTVGATSFETPLLPTGKTFYFVVRARDRAGNEDSNTIEKEGQNLCE
jgi:hypothetical protein